MNEGVSLYVVQGLLGHTQPRTTQRYAHLAQDTLNNAAEVVATVIGRPADRPPPPPPVDLAAHRAQGHERCQLADRDSAAKVHLAVTGLHERPPARAAARAASRRLTLSRRITSPACCTRPPQPPASAARSSDGMPLERPEQTDLEHP